MNKLQPWYQTKESHSKKYFLHLYLSPYLMVWIFLLRGFLLILMQGFLKASNRIWSDKFFMSLNPKVCEENSSSCCTNSPINWLIFSLSIKYERSLDILTLLGIQMNFFDFKYSLQSLHIQLCCTRQLLIVKLKRVFKIRSDRWL